MPQPAALVQLFHQWAILAEHVCRKAAVGKYHSDVPPSAVTTPALRHHSALVVYAESATCLQQVLAVIAVLLHGASFCASSHGVGHTDTHPTTLGAGATRVGNDISNVGVAYSFF